MSLRYDYRRKCEVFAEGFGGYLTFSRDLVVTAHAPEGERWAHNGNREICVLDHDFASLWRAMKKGVR